MVDITKKQGFIGLLAVLVLSSGVTYLVVDDDFSGGGLYTCEVLDGVVFEFDRLSGSLKRGYPTAGTTKGYVDCSSFWKHVVTVESSGGGCTSTQECSRCYPEPRGCEVI